MASFVTNCYRMPIWEYVPKYNLFSLYSVRSMYVLWLTIGQWTPTWCSPPWGGPPLLLPSFPQLSWHRIMALWAFLLLVWRVHWHRACLAHVWAVMGVTSDIRRRHGLTATL